MNNKYFTTKYDTNYVARPKEKWLIRLLGNQTGNYIHAKGTVRDVYSEYDLHTKTNNTVGVEVNYCDIAATFSINPAKLITHGVRNVVQPGALCIFSANNLVVSIIILTFAVESGRSWVMCPKLFP